MALIAIDFDGTLVLGDKEIEGARKAVNLLREAGHKVVIHSCNNPKWIETTLNNLDIRYDGIATKGDVLNGKLNADMFIDDKGFRFTEWSDGQIGLILDILTPLDNRRWDRERVLPDGRAV